MSSPTFGGVYLGVVHDTKDPLKNGRLKLRVPQVFGNDFTEWAPALLGTTSELELPKVNQTVWVMFQSGDPGFPVWIGSHSIPGQPTSKVLISSPTPAQLAEEYVISTTVGTQKRLNLVATLAAMSQEIESLVDRVTSLEARMTAEENKPDLT